MKRKSTSNIISLLITLTLGILAGMLFSPTSGTNIRSFLLYKLEELLKKNKIIITAIADVAKPAKNT